MSASAPVVHSAVLSRETWPLQQSVHPSASTVSASIGTPRRLSEDARDELARQTLEHFRQALRADSETRRALLDQVVEAHLWVADSVARRFRHRGEEDDDLLQVARMALVEACTRFDPEQGSFATFAFVTVSGVVKRHFRDHTWSVRPPRRTQELSLQVWQRWPELTQTLGHEPTEHDLAHALEVSPDDVRRAVVAKQSYSHSSLDLVVAEPVDVELDTDRLEARMLIASVWPRLSDAERQLLLMRFFEERRQDDIALELGVSQMQVSRLLSRLMVKLSDLLGPLDEAGAAGGRPAGEGRRRTLARPKPEARHDVPAAERAAFNEVTEDSRQKGPAVADAAHSSVRVRRASSGEARQPRSRGRAVTEVVSAN